MQPSFHIPPPDWASDPALLAVMAALPGVRLVGGCVRDAIAGRPVNDVDLATPEPPEAVMRALQAARLKAVPTGLQHGTVTAVSSGRGYEVTTLRRDESTDGRHATVAWTADWREDAARRDFTINAMSMGRDGAVWDYFGGAEDLRAGRVRFVGNAAARIAEDYLRVLRFFRFHARYGEGPPDAEALTALRGGVPGLARLSPERVWSELKRILATPDPREAVALMMELGVLPALLPPPLDPGRLDRLVAAGAPPEPLLRLAALCPAAGAPLAEALRMSTSERDRLLALHGPAPAPGMDDDALRRLLADAPPAALPARGWLAQADVGGDGWAAVQDRLAALPRPRFPLAGRDALALGVPAGPAVGTLLAAVRDWWLAGGCVANAAACRAQLAARAAMPS
ncbi:MAG TPA: CCA tRNA nucleotidyltransferase [Acetobacteraceae bacterium]